MGVFEYFQSIYQNLVKFQKTEYKKVRISGNGFILCLKVV